MLSISGIVTNHGRFTPQPSADNPQPQTYHTLTIEGVNVSLPDAGSAAQYPIGKEATVAVTANKAPQGGYKFRLLPINPV